MACVLLSFLTLLSLLGLLRSGPLGQQAHLFLDITCFIQRILTMQRVGQTRTICSTVVATVAVQFWVQQLRHPLQIANAKRQHLYDNDILEIQRNAYKSNICVTICVFGALSSSPGSAMHAVNVPVSSSKSCFTFFS